MELTCWFFDTVNMHIFDKSLALIFSLMILGQAYLVRRYVGTWLFPACLFGLFWFGLTFVPLLLLLPVPINPMGSGFILLCLVAFSLSAVLFPWRSSLKAKTLSGETSAQQFESSFLKNAFYVLSCFATALILMDYLAQGFSLHDLLYDLIATAAAYRNLVSFDQLSSTIYGRLGEILIYDVAILGGLIISSTHSWWKRLAIVSFSFAPGTLMAVAQSTKWALFSCLAFFYAGLLAYRVAKGDFRLFHRGVIKKAVPAIAILALITTVSFMSRGLQGSEDSDLIRDRLRLMFASYTCGHLYGFSDWYGAYMAANWDTGYQSEIRYQQEDALHGKTYGLYTFTPLFRFFGSTKVIPPDTFNDYYEYGNIMAGNIYTMFRGLIEDFGLVGCLLFMFSMGLLSHWCFHAMLRNRIQAFGVVAFTFFVGFFYASFGRSLFSWSGIYFTFFLLAAVLTVNRYVSVPWKLSTSLSEAGT